VQGKSVNLLVPGLFRSFQLGEIDSGSVADGFFIQKLIAKSDDITPFSQCITTEYRSTLPLAYYEYLASGLDEPFNQNILFADPVNLELKSDHILAWPISLQSDDLQNLSKIINIFNEHFSEDGISLEISSHGRVFCHSKSLSPADMIPVNEVLGRDIKHFLPSGTDAKDWLSIFNETQMLLHEKLTYEERIIGGRELNSFWFWGGGQLENNFDKNISYLGDARWLKGFCGYYNVNLFTIEHIQKSTGNSLYCIDESLLEASSVGDYKNWINMLTKIENEIILPLYNLLLSGDIESLIIHESPEIAYKCTKKQRYRILRKPVSLESICVSPP